ncbi:hypothetical protein ACRALDRAFT_207092 [Sodiomyces alcalophilus JCM 7366]|uniref:uncharacterized protein n=1 Tax=Sodiomyces alcalophilus JCM 7366 TaxID=591952 RepID=UPI0039B5C10A
MMLGRSFLHAPGGRPNLLGLSRGDFRGCLVIRPDSTEIHITCHYRQPGHTGPAKQEAHTSITSFIMDLTPIKVRGKKLSKVTARHRAALAKRRAAAEASAAATTEDGETTKRRPVTRKKSLLERQLPLEILERIFLLSENVAFPRSSPLLGRLLSGHGTLIAALIAAFGPTWDAHFGVNRHQIQSFSGDHLVPCLCPGNPDFQVGKPVPHAPTPKRWMKKGGALVNLLTSDIIACPWATIDLILEAQQIWARRFAPDRWYAHDMCFPSKHDNAGGRGHFDAFACFAHDFDHMHLVPEAPDLPLNIFSARPRFVAYIDVHPNIRIPDNLVVGPWTPEMIRRIFWLRRGGARFHASQTWELRLQAFCNAVTECPPSDHNPHLIRSLFLLRDFFYGDNEDEDADDPTARLSWPKTVMVEEYEKVVDMAEEGGIREIHCLLDHMEDILSSTL